MSALPPVDLPLSRRGSRTGLCARFSTAQVPDEEIARFLVALGGSRRRRRRNCRRGPRDARANDPGRCARRTPSMSAARAATGTIRSMSRPQSRWWLPPAACRWPSTAIARHSQGRRRRHAGSAGARSRSGDGDCRGNARTISASASCLPAAPSRDGADHADPQSDRPAHDLQPDGAARQSGERDAPIDRHRPSGLCPDLCARPAAARHRAFAGRFG